MQKTEDSMVKLPFSIGPNGILMVDKPQEGLGGARTFQVAYWTPQFFVDEPFVRNFVVSAVDYFILVQKEYKSFYPEPVPQKMITSISRMYRGLVLELCQNLKEAGDLVSADLYANLDFVWNFCEIMFLASHPDLPIQPYLVDWVKINFDLTPEILPTVLNELPDLGPETSDSLWNLIYSHIFHGATEDAGRLMPYLKHTLGNVSSVVFDRQVGLMNELLVKKPHFNPDGGSIIEFENMFTAWQEECLNRLEQSAFHGNERLTFLCKVLCGDDEAFSEAATKKLMTWYEYMVMLLTYKYPTIRPGLLKGYARKTLDELDLSDKLESRDMILLQAMEFNILEMLREIQNVWDNPFFALHFSDLVFACGRANVGDERVDYSTITPLRNHFIIEYGSTLVEHRSLWQMGIHYLEALPENIGRAMIRETIRRKRPGSEAEAQKLLQIAEKFSFGSEISGICRQIALEKLNWGQMQNALLWAIKAGDGPLTTKIVDSILFDGECEIGSSMLDSLKNVIPCANRLVFLNDFCDFRKSMSQNDYKQALKQLCRLITDDLIPKRIAHKILLKNYDLFKSYDHFERGQVGILTEFLHIKMDREKLGEEEFKKLNANLITLRTQEIVTSFRQNRNQQE